MTIPSGFSTTGFPLQIHSISTLPHLYHTVDMNNLDFVQNINSLHHNFHRFLITVPSPSNSHSSSLPNHSFFTFTLPVLLIIFTIFLSSSSFLKDKKKRVMERRKNRHRPVSMQILICWQVQEYRKDSLHCIHPLSTTLFTSLSLNC